MGSVGFRTHPPQNGGQSRRIGPKEEKIFLASSPVSAEQLRIFAAKQRRKLAGGIAAPMGGGTAIRAAGAERQGGVTRCKGWAFLREREA